MVGLLRSVQIAAEMERLVNLVKGEEAPAHDTEDDGWNHPLFGENPSDIGAQTDQVSATEHKQTSAPVGSLFDDDDDDDRIVEV